MASERCGRCGESGFIHLQWIKDKYVDHDCKLTPDHCKDQLHSMCPDCNGTGWKKSEDTDDDNPQTLEDA